jgi:hypothetical protein
MVEIINQGMGEIMGRRRSKTKRIPEIMKKEMETIK